MASEPQAREAPDAIPVPPSECDYEQTEPEGAPAQMQPTFQLAVAHHWLNQARRHLYRLQDQRLYAYSKDQLWIRPQQRSMNHKVQKHPAAAPSNEQARDHQLGILAESQRPAEPYPAQQSQIPTLKTGQMATWPLIKTLTHPSFQKAGTLTRKAIFGPHRSGVRLLVRHHLGP